MSLQNTFEGQPVLGWSIDSFDRLDEIIKEEGFDLVSNLDRFKKNVYEKFIEQLFFSAPIKLNLGGETEKSRIVPTDKSTGIFDFSLASRGLYRVPEYYSFDLAQKYPTKFSDLELPSGVVPSNLVKQQYIVGENKYFYQDNGETFNCVIRQKGQTAIDEGIKGAKLKFATRNKKVYLTYKKSRGKVKYVEIYSLFYYTSLSSDSQFAIRHIPALMVAEYLESMGVMTRVYMTRFVQLDRETLTLREKDVITGANLPLYEMAVNKRNGNNLFVQPIIAKEFGQEFDKALAFFVSSSTSSLYEALAKNSLRREVTNTDPTVFGTPNWEQNEYFEGLERYRNKYEEYVKLGLFKSKEVLPEAMLFFHDMAIKRHLSNFSNTWHDWLRYTSKPVGFEEIYSNVDINPFFAWWMKLSATNLKNKIDIVNSNNLRKDLSDIKVNLQDFLYQMNEIINDALTKKNITGDILGEIFQTQKNDILRRYEIIDTKGELSFQSYILNITTEITSYAEGKYFETDQESKEKRNELVGLVINELQNI